MIIKSRTTHSFIELRVDEVETTIFKGDNSELKEMIENLKNIIEELETYIEN